MKAGEMKTYTTFQVSKDLGVSRETITDWLKRGFITPSIRRARGVGTKNIFSDHDLFKIKLFMELKRFGFARKKAAEIIKDLEPGWTKSTQHFTLMFYERRK